MVSAIEKQLYKKCVGCGLCFASCPKHAITMEINKEGFLTPTINKNLCLKCKKCFNNCTSNYVNIKEDRNRQWFFAQAKPEYERKCSSGGIFYSIADEFINNGGYVCGAVLKHSSNGFYCEHVITNNKKELLSLLGSKYIQSDASIVFDDVQKLLTNNNKVLFVGTPCQVYALKKYLKHNYSNLILIDFLCFGTMSTKALNEYVLFLERKHNKKIKDIKFRAKFDNIEGTYYQFIFDDDEYIIEPAHFSNKSPVGLHKDFCDMKIINNNCINCQFKNINRISDLTLGDIPLMIFDNEFKEKYKQEFDVYRGISLISFNDKLRKNFLTDIKKENIEIIGSSIQNVPSLKPHCSTNRSSKFLKRIFKK